MTDYAYLGDSTALVRTRFGKMFIDTRDISLAPHLALGEEWEPWVTNVVQGTLRKMPGCTFVDVGANVGWYTLAALYFGAARVMAFEPNPRLFDLLNRTLAVNGMRDVASVYKGGCGATNETRRLHVIDSDFGGAKIMSLAEEAMAADWAGVTVDLMRLDRFQELSTDPRPLFVKIDVEGLESEVVSGMLDIFDAARNTGRYPVLLVETHTGAHEVTWRQFVMLQWLTSRGYIFRIAQHNGFPGAPVPTADVMLLADADMVLCTHGSFDE